MTVQSQDQWDELLQKDGLIGRLANFVSYLNLMWVKLPINLPENVKNSILENQEIKKFLGVHAPKPQIVPPPVSSLW